MHAPSLFRSWTRSAPALVALLLVGAPHAQPDGRARPAVAVITVEQAFSPFQIQAAAAAFEDDMEIDLFGLGSGRLPSVADADLSQYDLVFLEGIGVQLAAYADEFDRVRQTTPLVVVSSSVPIEGNVSLADHPWIEGYWDTPTPENYDRLFRYLGTTFLGLDYALDPPDVLPDQALYHPAAAGLFLSLDEYLAWYRSEGGAGRHRYAPDSLTVGLLFYRTYYAKDDVAYVDALVDSIEARGHNAVPLMSSGDHAFDLFLGDDGTPVIDVLVTAVPRLNYRDYAQGVERARALDVPILGGYTHRDLSPEAWAADVGGFAPSMSVQLTFSEKDGLFEPIAVAGRATNADGRQVYEPIPGQVGWRVRRALAWARLRRADNARKRIVIPYYSEGGGKGNVGADPDSYLDAQASLANLLRELRERGYDTGADSLPDGRALAERMSEHASNVGVWAPGALASRVAADDVALIPEETYAAWFAALPENRQREVTDRWGPPPGRIMVHTDAGGRRFLVIPTIEIGNVLLAPHPTWGYLQDVDVLYSVDALPPHHAYVAYFLWLQNEYRPHAMLTVFSNVSLMPGKMEGPAVDDWVSLLVGDVPHIHPFPLQANGGLHNKRRANALVIGYMPDVVSSDLYENLLELQEAIARYRERADGALEADAQAGILAEARALDLERDLGLDLDAVPFNAALDTLQAYLDEVRREHMPYGSHTLGEAPRGEALALMVASMMGRDFRERLAPYAADPIAAAEAVVSAIVLDGTPHAEAFRVHVGASAPDSLATLGTLVEEYARRVRASEREIPRIADALEGRYIEPGPMDDPIRNPDALPSGRTPYGLDSDAMPTREAWAAGQRLAEETLAQHRETTGAYPARLAFVLWSSEIAKHHGVMEAEILHLLGTRPVWDARGRVRDVELVPTDSLGRPRVDVLVTTSGVYRDHFGDKVALIDRAVRLVAAEPGNVVWEHTEATVAALLASGATESDAREAATARVFSPAVGAYSPSIQFAAQADDTWESDTALSDLYLARMSHAYGEGRLGISMPAVFREQLRTVDGVVFSRSSNVYGVLEHPMVAAYMGGMQMAVRNTTGRTAAMYVTNLRDGEAIRVETLERFFSRELRSRYFNPRWIEGMVEHGYDGARYMAGLAENMWVWDVTSPDLVRDADWERVREVYLDDEYDLGLDAYFEEHNPYARQTMLSTMLGAVEKGYWTTSTETTTALAEALAESVERHGAGCNTGVCNSRSVQRLVESTLNANVATQALAGRYADGLDAARRPPTSPAVAAAEVAPAAPRQSVASSAAPVRPAPVVPAAAPTVAPSVAFPIASGAPDAAPSSPATASPSGSQPVRGLALEDVSEPSSSPAVSVALGGLLGLLGIGAFIGGWFFLSPSVPPVTERRKQIR